MPESSENRSLGEIPLPDRTFEHDVAVSNGYQNFSAELLRLALAGIGAVGLLIVNMTSGQGGGRVELLMTRTILGVGAYSSMLIFGLSAAFALAHRYIGTDSKAFHLKYLRLRSRNRDGDDSRAEKEKRGRKQRLDWSGRLLIASSICLWLGAMVLAISFYPVIFKFREF